MKWRLGFLREPAASVFDKPRNEEVRRIKINGSDEPATELG
jgi:hypothetical protein